MPAIQPADYKAAKEAFVSNLNGSGLYEIIKVTIPLPVALWAYTELRAFRLVYSAPTPGLLLAFCYEFAVLIFPQILAQCWPESTPWVLAGLLVIGVSCRAVVQATREPSLKSQWRHDRAVRLVSSQARNFLINYRAGVMLTSAIAILAVDFTIFPRRFGKTETFGTSLMDLGVGCFIFSSGFCSRAARLFHHHSEAAPGAAAAAGVSGVVCTGGEGSGSEAKEAQGGWTLGRGDRGGCGTPTSSKGGELFRFSKRAAMWRTTKRCIPLVLLGLGRLLARRSVDYQEHVSEYGVHWNFFLTLAVIQLATSALHTVFPHKALSPLALIVLVLYQMQLSVNGLTEYMFTAPREGSLIAQNREGILGVIGFLCLYLIGEQIGTWTVWAMGVVGGGTKITEAEAKRALLQLVVLDAGLWGATALSCTLVQPISRRLVNMSYVLMSSAYNVMVIALLLAVDRFASMAATSRLLFAVNRNQLAFFILANLLTGGVNLSMHTLYASPFVSWVVISSYTLVLLAMFVMLDRAFDVTLKFW